MIFPNHTAILVPSVRQAARRLNACGFNIGPEELWEGEGTREIYVEKGRTNALLLMEPVGDGPYRRALAKRGPGFHHMAIDVAEIESYIESISGSGWLLHPRSLTTIRRSRTAYLARPGFPCLIEVQENAVRPETDLFVSRVLLNFETGSERLLAAAGLGHIVARASSPSLVAGGHEIRLEELWS